MQQVKIRQKQEARFIQSTGHRLPISLASRATPYHDVSQAQRTVEEISNDFPQPVP